MYNVHICTWMETHLAYTDYTSMPLEYNPISELYLWHILRAVCLWAINSNRPQKSFTCCLTFNCLQFPFAVKSCRMQTETRSVSVQFLQLTDYLTGGTLTKSQISASGSHLEAKTENRRKKKKETNTHFEKGLMAV